MSIIEVQIVQIAKLLAKAVLGTSVVSETENIDEISKEANKQALELQMAHAQAKVAQEIAIAQRIENASEVVIEEYYAYETLGEAGLKANESGIGLSASGESRRVTKRVCRFVGEPTSSGLNAIEQKQQDNLNNSKPRNIGLPWSNDSRDELAILFGEGKTITELSEHFERTKGGIKSELKHQDLLK